jgi:enoyl-CoA hydratase/carnithine racemase
MITPTSFEFSIKEGIGQIRLNRPEAYNALTFDVYRQLTALFADLQNESSVRVVTITGNGKAFSTGGDVREIIGPLLGKDEELLLAFTRMTCDLIWNMRNLNKPIIAALNGVVAGAGAMIAIASDFRIANEDARIAFLFVHVGLSGADMGACYLLPRLVGLTHATELLVSGNFITAQEAYRIGLYNRVVAPIELPPVTLKLAQILAKGPANGIAVTKQQLNLETLPRLKEILDAEATVQAKCMMHPDFEEGYKAFLEKRKPNFK